MPHAPCAYEELSHTAEIGLRLRAAAPGLLFACAGEAMFALIGAEVDASAPARERTIRLAAPDVESLMVDWLNELVYLYETTGDAFTEIEVTAWASDRLEAIVRGRRPQSAPRLHVKAVTYHALVVRPEGDGWLAEVTFDI